MNAVIETDTVLRGRRKRAGYMNLWIVKTNSGYFRVKQSADVTNADSLIFKQNLYP